jgi:hypothetical protein
VLNNKRLLKIFAACFFLLVFPGQTSISLAHELSSEDEFRLKVLRILNRQGFVKNATCTQFSSLILTRNGLPAVGKNAPVKGSRGNMDRRYEGTEPPIFSDETTWSEKPYYDVTLSSEKLQSHRTGWVLNLVRTFDLPGATPASTKRANRTAVKTSFIFDTEGVDNRASCELQNIQVQAEWSTQGHPQSLKKTLSAADCISLFDVTTAKEPDDSTALKIYQFMKDDCSTGLRYYKSVKEAISRDSLR